LATVRACSGLFGLTRAYSGLFGVCSGLLGLARAYSGYCLVWNWAHLGTFRAHSGHNRARTASRSARKASKARPRPKSRRPSPKTDPPLRIQHTHTVSYSMRSTSWLCVVFTHLHRKCSKKCTHDCRMVVLKLGLQCCCIENGMQLLPRHGGLNGHDTSLVKYKWLPVRLPR
jgi:hypothetical protein